MKLLNKVWLRLTSLKNRLCQYAFFFAVVATSFTLGLIISIIPTGVSARLIIILLMALSLVIAWGYRTGINKIYLFPIFLICIFTISQSIVWPRYIYAHLSGLPSINTLTLATMVTLYIISVSLLFSTTFSSQINKQFMNTNWTGKLIVIWLTWRFFSTLTGIDPIFSIAGFVKELIYVNSFILFGYVVASMNNGPTWLFRTILFCGLLVGLAGIYEAFTEHNFFVGFASAGEDGDLSGTLANIMSEKIRAGGFRAQSTFDHPIVFAQFVAALVPIAVFSMLFERSKFWRVLAFLSLPIALVAIAKSGSRAGIVSVMLGFGLMGFIFWLRALIHGYITRIVAIFSLPVLIGAIGLGYMIFQELAAGRGQHEASSTGVRMLMIRTGIDALGDSPIWGFGQGLAITKAGVINTNGLATIDNYFLSIALDSGYVGLALFLGILIAFTIKSLSFAVKSRGKDGLFVGACLAAVLAIAATFAGLSIINNMTLLWLLVTATAPFLTSATSNKKPMPLR